MPEVIVVVNAKGGTGKTTTSQSVAAALARLHDKKVLAIDADSQGSLTLSCGISRGVSPTLHDVIVNGVDPLDAIVRDQLVPFDLIPGNRKLAFVDIERQGHRGNDRIVKGIVDRLQGYDYIVIDAARGFEMTSISAIIAADGIIIPCEAQYLSQAGLEDELDTFKDVRNRSRARWVRVLFTRYSRSNHAQSVIDNVRGTGIPTFDTIIRTNVDLAAAAGRGTDIFNYAPRSNGAADYAALTREIVEL